MHKNNYKVNENEYCFIHFPKSGGTTFNFYLNYFYFIILFQYS